MNEITINTLLNKYGDIKLSEILEKMKNIPFSDIRLTVEKSYGAGCYELTGESSNYDYNSIKEYIIDEFDGFIFPEKEMYDEVFDDISDELKDSLVELLYNCGNCGNRFNIDVNIGFYPRKPTKKEIKDYLNSIELFMESGYKITDSHWEM